jgi:hypothetical protein
VTDHHRSGSRMAAAPVFRYTFFKCFPTVFRLRPKALLISLGVLPSRTRSYTACCRAESRSVLNGNRLPALAVLCPTPRRHGEDTPVRNLLRPGFPTGDRGQAGCFYGKMIFGKNAQFA